MVADDFRDNIISNRLSSVKFFIEAERQRKNKKYIYDINDIWRKYSKIQKNVGVGSFAGEADVGKQHCGCRCGANDRGDES